MDELLAWLGGRLSPRQRIWTALAPALLASAYFLVGLAVYAVRSWVRGVERDAELESRPATPLLGLWLRLYFAWLMRPLWKLLLISGIPAKAVTTLSVLLAAAAGVALAAGRFALGGWLYILAGICDFFDGRLARRQGAAARDGGVLDSVLDRYSDAAVLMGLCWYYRASWMLLACLAALVGSFLVPYIRAKGESAGVRLQAVGVMQRAERIACLGLSTAVSPVVEAWLAPADPHPAHRIAMVGVVLLAASTQLTAARRLFFVLGELRGPDSGGWLERGPRRLPRLAAGSLSLVVEFALLLALVSLGGISPSLAAGVALLFGAGLRAVVHPASLYRRSVPLLRQELRFAGVSLTAALLVAAVLAVLRLLPGVDYRLAWVLARFAVLAAWSLPLHRDYVPRVPASPSPGSV